MFVKAIKPFTRFYDGVFFSPANGAIFETTDETGAQMIEEGLVVEYTLITPTGTKTITANGTDIDVATYAKADVAVPQPTGNVELAPTGSLDITENGTYDVTQYAQVVVTIGG